uniref:Translation initiation factor 5A-like N-terminal domain-containing protein n=1 Tax=Equus asinus TaxID=9793 RepID=A0A8C4PK78_EQUAS
MVDEMDFSTGDAGPSSTYPPQCSTLSENSFLVLKGRPCKIVGMSASRTRKCSHQGSPFGIDILTGKNMKIFAFLQTTWIFQISRDMIIKHTHKHKPQ